MTFRVGMKVVRIGSTEDRGTAAYLKAYGKTFSYPEMREVCTVASIAQWGDRTLLRFREHDNSHLASLYPIEPGFESKYFRPLVDTKQEVSFTTGAPIDSERYDNRRRVVEPMPVDGWRVGV